MDPFEYPRRILERRLTPRNIEIQGWNDLGDEHHIEATWGKPEEEINPCPECGTDDPDFISAGAPDRKMYDEPLRKPVYIELERQRYECKNCEGTILPSHPDVYRGRKMTVRLVRYIWKNYLRGAPFSTIAEKAGPAESTVHDVFHERAETMDDPLTSSSATVLSIDEIYLRGHGHLAVLVDPQSKEVIEVLRGTDLKSITPLLREHRNRLEKQEKQLEAIVMDMASHFRIAARNIFPDAKVVVDRFHVERSAYGAVHNVRRREAARADESGREPAPTDGFRTEWKRRKEKLEDSWHQMTPAEKMNLSAELGPVPAMESAYRAKERLVEIFEMEDRKKADTALRRWEDSLTEQIEEDFSSVTYALSNWREEILNYFDTDYTNAFIEATNRSIRQIHREGVRMKFKTLKAKVKFGIKERRRYREEGRLNPRERLIRVPL